MRVITSIEAMRVTAAVLLVLLATASPERGEAQAPRRGRSRADALFEAAEAAYEAERFDAAAELLEQALEVRPSAALQFNLARCYEHLERWDDAERAYLAYLEGVRNRRQRARVTEHLERVRRVREERARNASDASGNEAADAAAVPEVAATDEASATPDASVDQAAFSVRDTGSSGPSAAPFVLGGLGLAAGGAGVALFVLAEDEHAAASRADASGQESANAHQRSNDLALGATLAWAAGGALLVTGIIWLAVELSSSGGQSDGVSRLRISDRGAELRF